MSKKIPKKEIETFVDYFWEKYGYGKSYRTSDDFFDNQLTKKLLREAVKIYIEKIVNRPNSRPVIWGGGDTLDSEIVRDILFLCFNDEFNGKRYRKIIKETKKIWKRDIEIKLTGRGLDVSSFDAVKDGMNKQQRLRWVDYLTRGVDWLSRVGLEHYFTIYPRDEHYTAKGDIKKRMPTNLRKRK